MCQFKNSSLHKERTYARKSQGVVPEELFKRLLLMKLPNTELSLQELFNVRITISTVELRNMLDIANTLRTESRTNC